MSRSVLKTCRCLRPTPFHQPVAQPIAFGTIIQAFTRPYNTSQQLRDYPKEGVFQKNSPRTNPLTRSAQPGAFAQPTQRQSSPGTQPLPPDYDQQSVFQQPSYEQRHPRSALNKTLRRAVASVVIAYTVFLGFTVIIDLGTQLVPLPFKPGSAEDRMALDALTEEFNNLSIVQELRSHRSIDPNTGVVGPTYKEWPAYKAYSDPTSPVASQQRRENTLTTGPLKGSQGLAAQAVFWANDGESLVLLVNFGEAVCGWPGNVHGGAIYTVIDEAMGRLAGRHVPEKTIVTAKLEVDYASPCRPGEWYAIQVRVLTDQFAAELLEEDPKDGPGTLSSNVTLIKLLKARLERSAQDAAAAQQRAGQSASAESTPAPPQRSRSVIMSSIMYCVDETGPGIFGGEQFDLSALRDFHMHVQGAGLFMVPKGIELPPIEHRVGSLEY